MALGSLTVRIQLWSLSNLSKAILPGLSFFQALVFFASIGILTQANQFLIILSESENKIFYTSLPNFDDSVQISIQDSPQTPVASVLISDTLNDPNDLSNNVDFVIQKPRSIASWSSGSGADNSNGNVNMHILFVYDDQTHSIIRYKVKASGEILSLYDQETVVTGIQASQIAVDGEQNLYIIRKSDNEIVKVIPGSSESGSSSSSSSYLPTPVSLLSPNNGKISQPSNLISDALYIYWSNSFQGEVSGSISMMPSIQKNNGGSTSSITNSFPRDVQNNVASVRGVCASPTNLFYTGNGGLFVTTKNSTSGISNYVKVNSNFNQPSGCVYDPVSASVYVTDSANSLVYQVPAGFTHNLRHVNTLIPVVSADGASDVVLIDSGSVLSRGMVSVMTMAVISVFTLVSWSNFSFGW